MKIKKVVLIKWLVLLLVVFVQLITVVLLKNTDRFYVEKKQLLLDPQFSQINKYWTQDVNGLVEFSGNGISIVSQRSGFDAIFQTISHDTGAHYNVSFDIALQSIDPAVPGKGGAELFLIHREDTDEYSGRGKRLFSGVGEMAMTSFSQTVYVGSEVGSFDFAARVNRATGVFTLSNPVVSLLQELPYYKKIKAALIALWCLIFGGLAIILSLIHI